MSPDAGDVASDLIVDDGGQQGPMIGNFYLRFPDETTFRREVRSTEFWQWEQAFVDGGPDAGLVPVTLDAGTLIQTAMGHNFDIVGTITKPVTDADGGIVPDGGTETLEGWHVNFSGILPDAWVPYIVKPENPVRGMR